MKYSSLLTVLVTAILTLEVDCNEKKDSQSKALIYDIPQLGKEFIQDLAD